MPKSKKKNKQNNRPRSIVGEPANVESSLNIRETEQQPGPSLTANIKKIDHGSSSTTRVTPGDLLRELADQVEANHALPRQIAEQAKIISSLRLQSEGLDGGIQRLRQEVSKLKEENKHIHEEKEQIINKIHEIVKENQELQVKCKTLETQLQEKKGQNQQLEIQVEAIKTANNTLRGIIDQQTGIILKITEEKNYIAKEKGQISDGIYALNLAYQELAEMFEGLETQLQQKNQQNEQLEIQLEALKAAKLDLESQLSKASANNSANKDKLEKVSTTESDYGQKLIDGLSKENDTLKFNIENLKSENTDLTKIADNATVLAQKNAQLKRENQRLKMELDKLNPGKLQDPAATQIEGSKARK